jgi:hypothetical protein
MQGQLSERSQPMAGAVVSPYLQAAEVDDTSLFHSRKNGNTM